MIRHLFDNLDRALGGVPASVWAPALALSLVLAIVALPLARRRARLAGEQLGHPELLSRQERAKDRALFLASLIPAALFWGMVLAGSFKGLTACAAAQRRRPVPQPTPTADEGTARPDATVIRLDDRRRPGRSTSRRTR